MAQSTTLTFLVALASPSTYPCQRVGQWVIYSSRFGDSYHISELCELVELIFFVHPGVFILYVVVVRGSNLSHLSWIHVLFIFISLRKANYNLYVNQNFNQHHQESASIKVTRPSLTEKRSFEQSFTKRASALLIRHFMHFSKHVEFTLFSLLFCCG